MAASFIQEKQSRVVPSSTHHAFLDPPDAAATAKEADWGHAKEGARLIRRSRSLLSASSLHLLSGCSSLESLASLGLSLQDTAYSLLEAEFECSETLSSHGEQVVVGVSSSDDLTLYAGSSTFSGLCRSAVDALCCKIEGDGSCVMKTGEKKPPVRAMATMGGLLFCAHEDLKIRVWGRSGKEALRQVAALPTLKDCVQRGMLPGAYVQVRRKQRKSLWIQHVDAIAALAVGRREGLLYSASWDRSVKVWRLADLKCVESFRAHDDAVNALAVAEGGAVRLYTGSADGTIKAWGRSEGRRKKKHEKHALVSTLAAHRSAVNALAISQDGSLLYSGAGDKAIVVWERGPSMGAHLAGALRGHRHAVLCLAIAGPATLCSGSADRTIRLWHRVAGRLHTCLAVLEGHSAPIRSLAAIAAQSPCAPEADRHSSAPPSTPASLLCTGFSLCSASLDKEVKLWRIKLTATASSAHVDFDALQPAFLQGEQFRAR